MNRTLAQAWVVAARAEERAFPGEQQKKMSTSRSHHFVPGPTYDEMADPTLLSASLRAAAAAARADELDPLNLFNINWMGSDEIGRASCRERV